ncbi:MAG TPA: TcpE family conjugal transfer membrane protein [Solirubrobacteraceae bacterium]|nr:TcpE family conjugal transfer membrane protein [Solirubrobacteraceae bacterium]
MSDSTHPIRSYQRIFKPDRRIYQIDGRRLPIPGGVPLEWLCWAFCSLIGVLVLGQRSIVFAGVVAAVVGLVAASSHGWTGAVLGGLAGLVVTLFAGVVLDWLDWPLRLLVVPGMIATLAGQSSPDGRPTHRYLSSLAALRLRAARRTLDGAIGAEQQQRLWAPQVWIAPDQHSPILHHGRVKGPARLVFAHRVVAIPGRGRLIIRPAEGHRMRSGERLCEVVELGDGQVVEVRP